MQIKIEMTIDVPDCFDNNRSELAEYLHFTYGYYASISESNPFYQEGEPEVIDFNWDFN